MHRVHSLFKACFKVITLSGRAIASQHNKVLEIERKFWYDFDIEKKLIEQKATKINQILIVDEYVDNLETNFLLLNDFLLRKRRIETNINKWQLKFPLKTTDSSSSIENYFEIENVKQISSSIIDLSKKYDYFKIDKNIKDIDSLINAYDLKCYAKIKSHRITYLLDNVKIDLDETDFNYKLGEIELILDDTFSQANIEESIKKISIITAQLGWLKFNLLVSHF